MNIALVGYGKMGKTIEGILKERGHNISKIIDLNNQGELTTIKPENTDVVIEFTAPTSAFSNIITVLSNGVGVVSGSTGWLDKFSQVEELCKKNDAGGFFYASNFSLGVNIFFKLNKLLAQMMNGHGYQSSMVEIHHTQKLDAPSGTAITLAEGMIENMDGKVSWVNEKTTKEDELGIISERVENVPGTHEITYQSEVDTIKISHVARSRKGFALGSVLAAEWLAGKKGVFSMDDLLNI